MAYWLERAPPVDKNATVATKFVYPQVKVAQIAWDPATGAITPDTKLPSWVFTSKLVAKPDQLIKRRGKAGLLALNKTWEEARPWIAERAGKPQKVSLIFVRYCFLAFWSFPLRSRTLVYRDLVSANFFCYQFGSVFYFQRVAHAFDLVSIQFDASK